MINIVSAAHSSVGKKIVTGLTGLALILFILVHLAGNLTLYFGASAFNGYAAFLEEIGHHMLLPVAEVCLAAVFLFHIVAGVSVALRRREARTVPYYKAADAAHTSTKTSSSLTMIWTGSGLFVFLILHILQFRIANVMTPPAQRNLYNLVVNVFHQPLYVGIYTLVMLGLGLHLRHGFWSAFQSLGLNNKRILPFLYGFAVLFAVVIALGFLAIPIYMYTAGVATLPVGGH